MHLWIFSPFFVISVIVMKCYVPLTDIPQVKSQTIPLGFKIILLCNYNVKRKTKLKQDKQGKAV